MISEWKCLLSNRGSILYGRMSGKKEYRTIFHLMKDDTVFQILFYLSDPKKKYRHLKSVIDQAIQFIKIRIIFFFILFFTLYYIGAVAYDCGYWFIEVFAYEIGIVDSPDEYLLALALCLYDQAVVEWEVFYDKKVNIT